VNQIILVRHGQSDQHVGDLTGGWSDTHLTSLGVQQACRTARRLKAMLQGHPVRFVSSDLSRAVETATIIAKALGVQVELDTGLRESNNGQAAGLTRQAAEAIALPQTQPIIDWTPYPGAESWRAMTERVFACLECLDRCIDGTALLVTHGNSSIAIVYWWLQLCERCRQMSCEIEPCSITRLTINGWGERTIALLNDTGHLELD
jgi:broad specificity phosphatase PhoE